MHDDASTPGSLLPTPLRRSGPPTGPRSAGLSVVLPPPAAVVLDLDARRARAARAPVVVLDAPEASMSIQDRVRLRALEAASRP